MKTHFFLSVVASGLIAGQASAGTMGPVNPQKNWSWVGSVSAGPVWARGGESQTFYLDSELERTYAARKSTKALAYGELFVGLQKSLPAQWVGQLGLAAAASSSAKLQGEVWDDADSEFNNYQYRYKIRHRYLALKGKLLLGRYPKVMPWVSGSAGVGFNKAHNFSNTALLFEGAPCPNFVNHTNQAFSFTLGAGIQTTINTHWQVGVGYEFADWGKSELSRCAGQTMNTGLSLNHFYTNGALFNLTYVA